MGSASKIHFNDEDIEAMTETSLRSRPVQHAESGTQLEGMLVYDDGVAGEQPTVLVFHTWAGRTDAMTDVAKRIAGWGYRAYAADLFGKGVTGSGPEECAQLMMPFVEDRAMLQRRLRHVVDTAAGLPEVDAGRVVAIGFCFGGLCVLDLARIGAPVEGVASFHGVLTPPGNTAGNTIAAKVVAYHGWDDPMAPPDAVVAFAREFSAAQADWQLHAFGGAMHGFTAPAANDPERGIMYHEPSARRSFDGLRAFLAECLGA
jgi:dienelactone hydrolase